MSVVVALAVVLVLLMASIRFWRHRQHLLRRQGSNGTALGSHWPVFVADAFTDKPFRGNPAAVCLVPGHSDASSGSGWPDDAVMQRIAAEMNLSETAFLQVCGAAAPSKLYHVCVCGDTFLLAWPVFAYITPDPQ